MPQLDRVRNRILAALIVLGVAGLAAAAFLLSPFTQNELLRQHALEQAQSDYDLKLKQVEPIRGMDAKLKVAEKEIDQFYRERFPARSSEVAAELGRLAAKNGVSISGAKYDQKDSGMDGLARVTVAANVDGDYLNTVKFINALERDKMFFILASIELAGQQGGAVKLQVKMETFLRS